MNKASDNFLQNLYERRMRWVEANRENNFESGIRQLLSDIYPDDAHFLYELLQNAEDAGASKVHFKLESRKLTVEHNGLDFTEENVVGITGIGNTQKKDDINAIGQFGIGFKSVFSYTETPFVFCDSYSFKIEDLVCPTPCKRPENLNVGITRFVFPFDKNDRLAETAYEQIYESLNNFKENTLLFLTNIKEISWVSKNNSGGIKSCTLPDQKQLPLTSIVDGSNGNKTLWLKLSGEYKDSNKKHGIALAFKVENYQARESAQQDIQKDENNVLQIVPVKKGSLCVFFPASKETTGFRFHIHAPFASTVSRDSIPHYNEGNCNLRDCLVKLLINSIEKIEDAGLLNVSFLSVLPNNRDDLASFYEPFREELLQAMHENKWLPTASGGYANPKEIIRASNNFLRDLLEEKDLIALTGGKIRAWAPGMMRNQGADSFMNSLAVETWDNSDFANALVDQYIDLEYKTEVKSGQKLWLAEKSPNWFRLLYRVLRDVSYKAPQLWRSPIVFTKDSTLEVAEKVFFQPDEGDRQSHTDVSYVHPEIIKKGKDDPVEKFLRELGVRDLDEKSKLQLILKNCYGSEENYPDDEQHIRHVKRVVKFWRETGDTLGLPKYNFFLKADDESWPHLDELYLDKPFQGTGLSEMYETLKAQLPDFVDLQFPVWSGYKDIESFVPFTKKIGVTFEIDDPQKPRFHVSCNPIINEQIRSSDFRQSINCETRCSILPIPVDNFFWVLEHSGYHYDWTPPKCQITLNVAKLIWDKMCTVKRVVLEDEYRPNAQRRFVAPSVLVQQLKKTAWVPNKSGELYRPQDIRRSDLHKNFPYNDSNGWLTALDLGVKAEAEIRMAKLSTDVKEKQRESAGEFLKEEFGIGLELFESFKKAGVSCSPESLAEFVDFQRRKASKASFPANQITNLLRRQDKKADRFADQADVEYMQKNIWTRISRQRPERRAYLETMYAAEDGSLFCQLCQEPMENVSFLLRSGRPYYEACQLFPPDVINKEDESNNLALCPVCSAKYEELVTKGEPSQYDGIVARILEVDLDEVEEEELLVPVDLNGLEGHLRFVGKHWADLQTVLRESKANWT